MDKTLLEHLREIEFIMSNGDLNYAVEILEDLSIDYPENYHVASMLGECYLSVGNPEKAIKPLQWATKNPPQHKDDVSDDEKIFVLKLKKELNHVHKNTLWVDYYLLGCAYGRCAKFPSAIRHLRIADDMNPDNAEIIRNIGWIRCMQEKRDIGRAILRQAIDLDPTNALAYNDIGASYMFEENFSEAEKWINRAVNIDPLDDFINETYDKLEDLMALKKIFGQ